MVWQGSGMMAGRMRTRGFFQWNCAGCAHQARGSGAAAALMADAEARLAKSGVETAWLACAIGNHRAARFYEKCGWCRVGVVTYQAETATGYFPLRVWHYEKRVTS